MARSHPEGCLSCLFLQRGVIGYLSHDALQFPKRSLKKASKGIKEQKKTSTLHFPKGRLFISLSHSAYREYLRSCLGESRSIKWCDLTSVMSLTISGQSPSHSRPENSDMSWPSSLHLFEKKKRSLKFSREESIWNLIQESQISADHRSESGLEVKTKFTLKEERSTVKASIRSCVLSSEPPLSQVHVANVHHSVGWADSPIIVIRLDRVGPKLAQHHVYTVNQRFPTLSMMSYAAVEWPTVSVHPCGGDPSS
jgi:hypothetical protein